jgi:hypothetical protein
VESFEKERIEEFEHAPIQLNYIFKHVIEEKTVKKLKPVNFFLPEMCLISYNEELPGLKD